MTPPVCRVCLQIAEDPIDMEFALYRGSTRVTEMFKVCTEIQVEHKANKILCKECEKRLFDAYAFRCQAKEAESALKASLADMKDENMISDGEQEFYCEETVPEATATTVKSETRSETKVKKTPKTRIYPGMSNRFQCRFCLKILVEGLREHEKQHISKIIFRR